MEYLRYDLTPHFITLCQGQEFLHLPWITDHPTSLRVRHLDTFLRAHWSVPVTASSYEGPQDWVRAEEELPGRQLQASVQPDAEEDQEMLLLIKKREWQMVFFSNWLGNRRSTHTSSDTIVSLIEVFQVLADLQIHSIGLRKQPCRIWTGILSNWHLCPKRRAVVWHYFYTSLLWYSLGFSDVLWDSLRLCEML